MVKLMPIYYNHVYISQWKRIHVPKTISVSSTVTTQLAREKEATQNQMLRLKYK